MAIKFLTRVGSQSYNDNNNGSKQFLWIKPIGETAKFCVEVMNRKRQKEEKFGHAVYKFTFTKTEKQNDEVKIKTFKTKTET